MRELKEEPDDPEKDMSQIKIRQEKAKNLDQLWKEMNRWSCSIEVVYQSEKQEPLQTTVYFPFDPNVGLKYHYCHNYHKYVYIYSHLVIHENI